MIEYFGYGSNINLTSLRAKGVEPTASKPAILRGWTLRFNVRHWFRHEGGVGNIQQTHNPEDAVEGIVHTLSDEHLSLLDAIESYGVGYTRINVTVETTETATTATTYVGLSGYLDHRCLPTRRYLNILIKGAEAAGLSPAYIENLRLHPVYELPDYPPFQPPMPEAPVYHEQALKEHPNFTGLLGWVFTMDTAEERLHCVKELFGGKDTTLFHLKRHDTSSGKETMSDILSGNITPEAKAYLNAYLHEYAREFTCVGRLVYKE